MERLVLKEKVTITKPDFYGSWLVRKSPTVTLTPAGRPGWYWAVDGEEIPITPDLLQGRWRRLALVYGHHVFEEWEHWGFMRMLGLDEVVIRCDGNRPPFAQTGELYEACEKAWERSGELMPFIIPESLSFHERGGSRYVEYAPVAGGTTLCVRVEIHYPGLGECGEDFSFPLKNQEAHWLACTKTQGWPRWFYRVSRIAKFFGWPHHDKIFWPQENNCWITRLSFIRHRLLDLLGALSVLCPPGGILAGNIRSHCGGHETDKALMREADCVLRRRGQIEEVMESLPAEFL